MLYISQNLLRYTYRDLPRVLKIEQMKCLLLTNQETENVTDYEGMLANKFLFQFRNLYFFSAHEKIKNIMCLKSI